MAGIFFLLSLISYRRAAEGQGNYTLKQFSVHRFCMHVFFFSIIIMAGFLTPSISTGFSGCGRPCRT